MTCTQKWIYNVLASTLIYKLNLKNIYELPKIKKITVFVDFPPANTSTRDMIYGITILTLITNNRPIIVRSNSSISGSRLKKGTIVGSKCTISKSKIYVFLDILILLIIPQIKNLNLIKMDSDSNCKITINDFTLFSKLFNKDLNFKNNLNMTITLFVKSKNVTHTKAFLNNLQIPV